MVSDEQLAEQLKKGKRRALDELYARYAKPLYVFCAHSSRTSDPEDVVHDVFTRVIEHIETFNPQRALFRTWIYRIARHRCIDLARRDEHVPMVSLETTTSGQNQGRPVTLQDTIADDKENAEQTLTREAVLEAVRECIDALRKKDERDAFTLYFLTGKVYREIGDILGKSTSTAKNYITAAREKVKRCLEGKGF